MTPHLRRCQGFAAVYCGFTLDALNLGYPQLSLIQGTALNKRIQKRKARSCFMDPTRIDIINIVLNAGLMVQFVLVLLLFFSIASWTIMIMKYRYIKKAFYESAIFIDYFWKCRNLSDAFNKAKHLKGSPIARIFRVGYMELRKLSPSSGSTTQTGIRRPTVAATRW